MVDPREGINQVPFSIAKENAELMHEFYSKHLRYSKIKLRQKKRGR